MIMSIVEFPYIILLILSVSTYSWLLSIYPTIEAQSVHDIASSSSCFMQSQKVEIWAFLIQFLMCSCLVFDALGRESKWNIG